MARWVKSYQDVQVHKTSTEPTSAEDVSVGDIWIDTTSDAIYKVCTQTDPSIKFTVAGQQPADLSAEIVPSGNKGEEISSTIYSPEAVSLTTATNANVTNISLSAGTWEISGQVNFLPDSGSTVISSLQYGSSTVSATLDAEVFDASGESDQVVLIGDSLISGITNNSIGDHLNTRTGFSFDNNGTSGQTTTQIAARIDTDATDLTPRIVIVEGGVNDLASGNPVTQETFIANWTTMLDALQAESSIRTIIVLKIFPWTNGSNVNMQRRDTWNDALAELAKSYSKAIVVDLDPYIGQFRSGGDTNNLWDIKTAYNADGVHLNSAGYLEVAGAIIDHLPTPLTLTESFEGNTITPTLDLMRPLAPKTIKVLDTTTIYLVANAAFTTSTLKAYGTLRAKRI